MFLQNMGTAAQQVGILAILVLVGFCCDKSKLYTEKASRLTNDLLFYIVTPAVVTQSFLTVPFTQENAEKLLIAAVCGGVTHVAAILLSLPLFRKGERDASCIFKYACIYGNVGYMALPLAGAVLGEEGTFLCSSALVFFNIFAFTHGAWLMRRTGEKLDAKKLLVNPGTISVAIGLPLFLLSVKLPPLLGQPVMYLSNLNTPLAMILFGTYLANTDLKTMFLQKQAYLVSLFKLLILPLTMMAVFRLCGITGTLLTACIITAAVPSANNTIMFAAKYGKDTGLASKTVSVVSILSVVTMPLMIALSSIV